MTAILVIMPAAAPTGVMPLQFPPERTTLYRNCACEK